MVVEATHLRADAQRNLERILEAARAVFAEEGLEASGGDLFERPRMQELLGELTAAMGQLLRRAKAAGAIRRDVVAEDIGFLINAVGLAGLRLEHTAPGAWRRYVEIVLAGLSPQGGGKLAHKPPTSQQLHDSKRSR